MLYESGDGGMEEVEDGDPEKIFLLTAVQPVIGETEAIAKARAEFLDELIHPDVAIAFLSGMIGVDATGFDPDTPIDKVLESSGKSPNKAAVDGGAAFPWLERIREEDRGRLWTLRDIAIRMARSTSTPPASVPSWPGSDRIWITRPMPPVLP